MGWASTSPSTVRRLALVTALCALLLDGTPRPTALADEPPVDPEELCLSAEPTIVGAGVIVGTPGDDVILGSDEADEIDGGEGNDLICGGRGDDLLVGGPGDDTLVGGPGRDSLDGGPGDDILSGGSGRDTLSGGEGDDLLFGGSAGDQLLGGEGNDLLYGGSGGDQLDGGPGDDRLFGEEDGDSLSGGDGGDYCDGGSGRDEEDESCESVVLPEALASLATPSEATGGPLRLTHGVASGELTSRGAVVWARASGPGLLLAELDADPSFAAARQLRAELDPEADFTARIAVEGLHPDTRYHYRLRPLRPDGQAVDGGWLSGTFRTAPDPTVHRPVQLVYGGFLGGQDYCRRTDVGYAIFGAMADLRPDLFVASGDMTYADHDCEATGPLDDWSNVPGDFPAVDNPAVDWTERQLVREILWRHWRYNRADPHLQRLLSQVPVYAQWSDHEVANDFGADWSELNADQADRAGYSTLVQLGREAEFAYWPLVRPPDEPNRLYRRVRWGADLELFLLDTRSYRSRNDLPDSPEQAKTLLGAEQRAWLLDGLARSSATWKLVSSDVSLVVPAGTRPSRYGRDGWANGTDPDASMQTGFERELLEILGQLDAKGVRNLVFITSGLGYPQATRHRLDLDGDGRPLLFHELAAGPLSARRDDPGPLDPTLRPTLLYAEGGLFSFGYVQVEPRADGRAWLVSEVRDEAGEPRPGSRLELSPE